MHFRSPLLASLSLVALVACSSATGGSGGSSPTSSSGTGTGGATSTSNPTGGSGGAAASSTSSSATGGSGGTTASSTSSSATGGSGGSGIQDAGTDAPSSCTGDLSSIGSGDFRISFTIQTTQIQNFAVANQRDVCNAGNFWDIRSDSGGLVLETDSVDAGGVVDDVAVTTCATIDDGQPHDVIFQRVAGVLSAYVDGLFDSSVPSTSSFPQLPALVTGTDVCVGVDGTAAFDTTAGSITNLCVSTATEVQPDAGVVPCQ